MSFDKAFEHYKKHSPDWEPKNMTSKDKKAVETILLEFANNSVDDAGKEKYKAFKEFHNSYTQDSNGINYYFMHRSAWSGVISVKKETEDFRIKRYKLKDSLEIYMTLLRVSDSLKKWTICVGNTDLRSIDLTDDQVGNLLKFYKELDPTAVSKAWKKIQYGFTELKL